jgi:hypothetical protein
VQCGRHHTGGACEVETLIACLRPLWFLSTSW